VCARERDEGLGWSRQPVHDPCPGCTWPPRSLASTCTAARFGGNRRVAVKLAAVWVEAVSGVGHVWRACLVDGVLPPPSVRPPLPRAHAGAAAGRMSSSGQVAQCSRPATLTEIWDGRGRPYMTQAQATRGRPQDQASALTGAISGGKPKSCRQARCSLGRGGLWRRPRMGWACLRVTGALRPSRPLSAPPGRAHWGGASSLSPIPVTS
jgi:hypothetical protein